MVPTRRPNVLADLGVDLSTTVDRVEGIEHAEAYDADGKDLCQRRVPVETPDE